MNAADILPLLGFADTGLDAEFECRDMPGDIHATHLTNLRELERLLTMCPEDWVFSLTPPIEQAVDAQ